MKRNSKITVLFALVLCLALALSGCGVKTEIAAKVGDREVTVAQIENNYNSSASMAFYYGHDTSTEEGIEAYVQYIAESLTTAALLAYQAEQAGITLTEEEQETAQTAADAEYDAFYQSIVDYATQQGAVDVDAQAKAILTDTLVQSGLTLKELKQDYLDAEVDARRVQKHKNQLLEGVAPTAEQLAEMYETELASQKTLIEEDPAEYFTQETYYSYGYSYMPLVVPEGFFYVRHILVEDQETADSIMDKINAGEDFEALLKQYNTDPGMNVDDPTQGYLVGEGAGFVEDFLNGALSLEKEGDFCMVESEEYGFHIIKRLGDAEAREIPYEEVKEEFDILATANFVSEYYADIVDGWMADPNLVTMYPETYASVGK